MNLKDRLNRGPTDDDEDSGDENSGASGDAKPTLQSLLGNAPPTSRDSGDILTNYGGPRGESLESLRIAYQANPDNMGLANVLAGMLYTASQYEEAAELYQKIVDRETSDGKSWLQLANCQTGLGQWDQAFRSYAWALQYVTSQEEKTKCQERMAAVEKKIVSS